MAQGVGGYLHSFVVVEGTMSLSNPSLQCCPACHTCPITLQIPRATSHSAHEQSQRWSQTEVRLAAGTRRHWSLSENETPQWGTNLKTTGTTSTHPPDPSYRIGLPLSLTYSKWPKKQLPVCLELPVSQDRLLVAMLMQRRSLVAS
jgi:hypothetical protein